MQQFLNLFLLLVLFQVYIDTAEHEFDTLEQVWSSICHLPRYLIHQFKVGEEAEEDLGDKDAVSQDGEARTYTPDISNSSDLLSSHIDLASSRTDLASSRTDLASSRTDLASSRTDLASSGTYLASSRSDLSSSRTDLSYTRPESRISRSDLNLDLPYMPPLPPRSPTFTRRRSYQPPRSVPSTSRLPRSYMPSSSPTDEFSYSRYGFHRNSGLHLTYKNYPEFFSISIMENVLEFWINSETIFSVNHKFPEHCSGNRECFGTTSGKNPF